MRRDSNIEACIEQSLLDQRLARRIHCGRVPSRAEVTRSAHHVILHDPKHVIRPSVKT